MGWLISRAMLRLVGSPRMLHSAVRNRDVDRLRDLLDAKPELVDAPDPDGNRPLHKAVTTNSHAGTDIEAMLISYGADVNARDKWSRMPLHMVAMNGQVELGTLLLSSGAQADATDACRWTPLHVAAYHGYRDFCSLLISKGAVIDLPNEKWETPLHPAIYNRHRDVVRLLIEKGADVNQRCQDGRFINIDLTPLLLALRAELEDIAQLLIAKGADVNVADRYSITPLHEAAGRGFLRTIELLIKHGADPNAITRADICEVGGLRSGACGCATPVKIAILANRTKAVQLLRRYGGN